MLNFVQTYRSHRAAERLRDACAPTATALRDGAWMRGPAARPRPRRRHPLAAGRSCPGRRAPARGARPARPAGRADRRVAAGREGGGRPRGPAAPAGGRPQRRLPRHVGGERHGDGAGRRDRAARPRSATSPRASRRRRPRPSSSAAPGSSAPHHADRVLPRALRLPGQRAGSQHDPLESLLFAVALAVGLTPEFLPMITAVTLARGRRAHGAAEGDRQAPRGDPELRQHGRPLQRQDRHAHQRRHGAGAVTSTRSAQASERPLALAYLNSSFETRHQESARRGDPRSAARPPARNGYRKVDEIPFDFERRRLSVVVETRRRARCSSPRAPRRASSPAARPTRSAIARAARSTSRRGRAAKRPTASSSAQGSRVLGGRLRGRAGAGRVLAPRDERDLSSPASSPSPTRRWRTRRGARARSAATASSVKILTGDNELVARHVCAQVGLDGAAHRRWATRSSA